QKKVGLQMNYFWREIFDLVPAFIIPAIVGWILSQFVDLYRISGFMLSGVAYTGAFCASMWLLGLNRYEKDLFCNPIIRILKKCKRVE
ncbi:MAG: hypothetical protein RR710_08210, partial [Oscillospiraceae bacterium]